ncbi:MAG: NUDIX hydrolase [Planctomycetaceae bacterium]|nr:NUDIX hydrolase [Planctomycetaceae bacterium]
MPAPDEQLLLETSRFRVVERVQQAPAGPRTRQVVVHPGSVVILPLLDDGRVCLIRNERIAVGRTLIELPAGTLDHDEPPAATARRELQEETGYSATEWQELTQFFAAPGILSERMHVFVAERLIPGATAREPGENITNLEVPWDEALAMIDRGEIEDAKTIATLLLWDRRQRGRLSPKVDQSR